MRLEENSNQAEGAAQDSSWRPCPEKASEHRRWYRPPAASLGEFLDFQKGEVVDININHEDRDSHGIDGEQIGGRFDVSTLDGEEDEPSHDASLLTCVPLRGHLHACVHGVMPATEMAEGVDDPVSD